MEELMELHYPGGFYLLMLELTARSRQWYGSPLLWCAWRNGYGARLGVPDDHRAVFEESLVVARDLHPMPSKHLHMLGLKSQLDLSGDVVMQQFSSPGTMKACSGWAFSFAKKRSHRAFAFSKLGV